MWVELDLNPILDKDLDLKRQVKEEIQKEKIDSTITIDLIRSLNKDILDVNALGLEDRDYNLYIWSLIDSYFVTGNNKSYELVNELLSKRKTLHSSLFQLKVYDITKDKSILTSVSDTIFKLDEYWGEDLLALAKLSYITQDLKIVKRSTEIMLNKLEEIERQGGIKSEIDVEMGMGALKGLSLININYSKYPDILEKIKYYDDKYFVPMFEFIGNKPNIPEYLDSLQVIPMLASSKEFTVFAATKDIKYLKGTIKLYKYYQEYLNTIGITKTSLRQKLWGLIALSRIVYFIEKGKILD
ncbi:hypothetical protein SULI_13230 [Saccharolobus solfataricus]|nr:hypothetical protein [Saccharolobus solfataricus]AKA75137.1 hypothetical protein SULB_2603 [Saccharolobus solfataricus]AKA77830.1 hypothetical protein SULC_2599 [Saccharolobus solfataricus]AKA80525.1 hypothetical protein SULA_2602 [Saccharolobus solfataricus]AZF69575.1 hypothetical protein SULG_13230 [Saccharolobus solfataricus]AZF72195.1 hypothetical protein SULH_13230 [Saccharolobus solfataricus]